MEDALKDLMQRLGNEINRSLSESKESGATIDEIKQAGYKVSLTLEASISFEREDASKDGVVSKSRSKIDLPSEG